MNDDDAAPNAAEQHDADDLSTFTPGERRIWRKLIEIQGTLAEITESEENMETAAENLETLLNHEDADVQAAGTRVKEVQTTLNTTVATLQDQKTTLEAELADLKAKGVSPEAAKALEAHINATDAAIQAIDAAEVVPVPEEQGTKEEPASEGPTKSVYVFTAAGDPDLTEWTVSGFETTDTPPVALYYFNGDSGPGETNGQGVGGWSVYTGTTQKASAPAA